MADQRQQDMRPNEVTSAEAKLNSVLLALQQRGDEIAHVLPRDLSLDAFLATVNQALRNNPKLLRCTATSLVNACVKAGYDGLRIDGKEAAIVDAEESYQENGAWKKRTVARYMPMVFGLIKQILDGGRVAGMHARIVYAGDEFSLIEGTKAGIYHKPLIDGERGRMLGAYSIATLVSGAVLHEWMRADEILDVQKEAKTDKVWKRWPTEMWKKTVIRRHRKTLPGTSHIRDMETVEMFPQFDRQTPHPQMGQNLQSSMPARPTRHALVHNPDNGVPLDLGAGFDDRQREPVEAQGKRQGDDGGRPQKAQEVAQQQAPAGRLDVPADDIEWGVWGTEMEGLIARAKSDADLDDVDADIRDLIDSAPKSVADRIRQKITDRAADIAAGLDDGAAAGGEGDGTAAGDE